MVRAQQLSGHLQRGLWESNHC